MIRPAILLQAVRGVFLLLYCISDKYPFKVSRGLDFAIFKIYTKVMKPKQKRRGRPPKGSDAIKSESILLRLEQREKKSFLDAATIAGTPLTVWIRERLRRLAGDELVQAGRENPFH